MAISSLELRIGNLVLDPYGNEREVTGFRGSYVYLLRPDGPHSIYKASELSPIPLNQEWLERARFVAEEMDEFSFTNKEQGVLLELSELYTGENNRAVFYFNLPDTDECKCIAYCNSLHSLCNLYFALTGSELEIAGKGI